MLRQPLGKPLVTARVLTEAMDNAHGADGWLFRRPTLREQSASLMCLDFKRRVVHG
jgi:hypothetical protein